jgi:hypothetical protein
MEDKSSHSVPPELRVRLDAEITVDGLRSDADQPVLESELADVRGVESLEFREGKVSIRYDAERVTEKQLREKVRQAGFQVEDSKVAPATPPVEAADENEKGRG